MSLTVSIAKFTPLHRYPDQDFLDFLWDNKNAVEGSPQELYVSRDELHHYLRLFAIDREGDHRGWEFLWDTWNEDDSYVEPSEDADKMATVIEIADRLVAENFQDIFDWIEELPWDDGELSFFFSW